MTKEERLEYLKEKQKIVNKFKSVSHISDMYSFLIYETEYEKTFMIDNESLKKSFMYSRLSDVKKKVESSLDCKRRGKNKDAVEFANTAINMINQDYSYVISMFSRFCKQDEPDTKN